MSISSISSSFNFTQSGSSTSSHKKVKEEFDALKQALQSGNLSGAQQAFTALQNDAPAGSSKSSGSDSVSTDINALSKALASGDLTSAQSAFSTLQTDIQKSPPPGGAQFRNVAANSSTSSSTSSGADQVQSLFGQLADALQSGDLSSAQTAFNSLQALSPDNSSTGNTNTSSNPLSNDVSSLGKALQSGDLSSAQSAFANLQNDLQNLPPPGGGPSFSGAAIGNSTSSSSTSAADPVQKLIRELAKALQSGDLSGAQSAFNSLQALSPDNQTSTDSTNSTTSSSSTSSTTSASTATNSTSSDLSSLSQALQSGDLSSAQSEFAKLLESLRSNGPGQQDQRSSQLDFYTQVLKDAFNSNSSSSTVQTSA